MSKPDIFPQIGMAVCASILFGIMGYATYGLISQHRESKEVYEMMKSYPASCDLFRKIDTGVPMHKNALCYATDTCVVLDIGEERIFLNSVNGRRIESLEKDFCFHRLGNG